MLRIKHLGVGVAALFAVALPGAAVAQDAGPTVSVQDFQFSPVSQQAPVGATVTFTFDGASAHTVTADDGSFDSGVLNQGNTFSMTFQSPGTYAYYCTIHGAAGGVGMAGTVVVS